LCILPLATRVGTIERASERRATSATTPVLNREDSSDGSLSIKDYFKTSDKYGDKRLLKSPYWGQSSRWDYDGQHETTEA
jgi:hypothetical protein